jgi:cyclic pyranopterin phosphate synthase
MQGLSLRISVTDRCPLRCAYCVPEAGIPKRPREEILSYEEIVRFVSAVKASYGLAGVRLTGGEPLVRPEIEKLVGMLSAMGAPDLALTTNGQLLAGKIQALKDAGLRRLNVSLDSLDPGAYRAITGGGILEDTLAGIAAARQAGLAPLKLNTVVVRGRNDHELPALVSFAMRNGCQMRFLERMPIGAAAGNGFVPSAEVRLRLEREFTLVALPADPAATSRNFTATGQSGHSAIVGFISPRSEPFCGACRRLRLTATGLLIGCLARPEAVPLAPLLRSLDPEAIGRAVEHALGAKRLDDRFLQPLPMVALGG